MCTVRTCTCTHSTSMQVSEWSSPFFTVIGYLVMFRMEELGMSHFRRFVMSQDALKMHRVSATLWGRPVWVYSMFILTPLYIFVHTPTHIPAYACVCMCPVCVLYACICTCVCVLHTYGTSHKKLDDERRSNCVRTVTDRALTAVRTGVVCAYAVFFSN